MAFEVARRDNRVICVVVAPKPSSQGGIASVIANYEAGGLFSNGRVKLICSYEDGSTSKKLAYAVRALLSFTLATLFNRPSVLHVHCASYNSFWRKSLFVLIAYAFSQRVVFEVHSGKFFDFIESLPKLRRRLAFWILRRSSRILCLSTEAHRWFRKHFPEIPSEVVQNPIAGEILEQHGRLSRGPLLLYLGALTPDKGVIHVLEAFQELIAAYPNSRLAICGDGPQMTALIALAEKLQLRDSVSFLGWVNGEAKMQQLHQARVLVLPSYKEAQPMVILEAMATGAVVVASDVGAIPELTGNGKWGVLVKAGDSKELAKALIQLWENDSKRDHIALAAQTYVRHHHHPAVLCTSLLALYEELARSTRPLRG